MVQLAFYEFWETVLIKYDPRHWMGNWFLMAQSKSSGLFKYFCTSTSDAIFKVWEGDASVSGTRAHVKAHLRKRFKHGVGVNMADPTAKKEEDARVDGLIRRVRRGYWRKHCRFTIPPPRELARRLLAVYYFFRDLDDPETGQPFLSKGHELICRRELGYVANGDLSDHPTIPLYIKLYTTATGLVISCNLRTSSGLEGYHQHLENAVAKCAKAAGLHYTNAVTNEFDYRWTVRAVRKRGLLPSSVRHFNLALIEYLHDTAVDLLGMSEGRAVVDGFRRTKLMTSPLVKHGMHYGLEAQEREATQEAASTGQTMGGEGGWLAERLGSSQRLHHRPTAMDVDALLSAPRDSTGQVLSDVAFKRGLHLPAAAAERWAEMREKDEAVRLELALTNYRELQQQLRTRVAPPLVMEATAPQRTQRTRVGTLALPGPHPGMATQRVAAAQLEAMEEEEGGSGEDGGGEDGGGEDGGGEDGGGQSGGGRGTGGGGSTGGGSSTKRSRPQTHKWKPFPDGRVPTTKEEAAEAKDARRAEKRKQGRAAASVATATAAAAQVLAGMAP